jgi:ATP-dependent RNA helicase DeaD
MKQINFKDLDLDPKILKALHDLNFILPTPIQEKSIPHLKKNSDLIGKAKTGTGKTLSFSVPLIEKINPKLKVTQGLIICPTRELVSQVVTELQQYSKYYNYKIVPIFGGSDYSKQLKDLKLNPEIIVGTPGRLLDHLGRGTIKTEFIHTVILDEADRMLDMGFKEDMESILTKIPESRQTIMFSATMSEKMIRLMREFQNNPVLVEIESVKEDKVNIEQYYITLQEKNKTAAFFHIIEYLEITYGIIFCNTKLKVDELVIELRNQNISVGALHGDLSQAQRERVLKEFKEKKLKFLIATDVAGRGIDVIDLNFVINYDFPDDIEDYIHRIGRTGRAGKTGKAITFISQKLLYKLRKIENLHKMKIQEYKVPTEEDIKLLRQKELKENLISKLKNRKKKTHSILYDDSITKDYTTDEVLNSLFELWMEVKWAGKPKFMEQIQTKPEREDEYFREKKFSKRGGGKKFTSGRDSKKRRR